MKEILASNRRPHAASPDLIPKRRWPLAVFRYAPSCLLITVLAILSWTLATYWVPADGGVDQNGYLVAARLMADEHTLHFIPEDPHQYVGGMIVQTEDGRM